MGKGLERSPVLFSKVPSEQVTYAIFNYILYDF